jgi:hypothetical protein
MPTLKITPQVLSDLNYTALCRLAGHLSVVNPRLVALSGTITLDDLGNFVSTDAELAIELEPDYDEWLYESERRGREAGIL